MRKGRRVRDDVLGEVRSAIPRLSAAERRVAERILEDPERVVDLTITGLAELCSSSQATIARFCQSVGFSGYREFRLALAAATSREQAARDRFDLTTGDIDFADSVENIASKIAYQETLAIEQTTKGLDFAALSRAATAIRGAARVDLYGVGASSLTAQDLQQKLTRVGLAAFFSADPHLALTSAALLGPGDVAVVVSHTGETLETLNVILAARQTGAVTVAITNYPASELAEAADCVLVTHARESRYRSGAMSSRIAQLTVGDVLFVSVAQGMPERMAGALERTYVAVKRGTRGRRLDA